MPALEGKKTNSSPLPIAATIALEMVGPIARTLIKRSHPTSRPRENLDLTARSSMTPSMRGDKASEGVARMRGSSARKPIARDHGPVLRAPKTASSER